MADARSRPGRARPVVPRPVEVRRAVLVIYVISLVYPLLAAIAILTREAAIEIAQDQESNLTDAEAAAAANGVVLIAVVVGVGVGVTGVVSAVNIARGRRWARVTATVAVAVAMLFSLLGVFGSGLAAALHTLVIIGAAMALYLLYRPSSAAFFAQSPRA